jgi:hypothetical protein
MPPSAPPHHAFTRKDLLILVLLLLAGAQCTLAIFYNNVSYINLKLYEAGRERNPFQERVAMIPLLRLAAHSPHLQRVAALLDAHDRRYPGRTGPECAEPYTPEKLACVLVGLLSMMGALAILVSLGRRHTPRVWWLPAALFLCILYVSFAARYEQNFWYPYDLPHMFLFGAASLAIFTGRPRLMLLCFALDLHFRETAIFLIPLTLCFLQQGWKRRQVLTLATAMLLAWAIVRVLVVHQFGHNRTEAGSHVLINLHSLLLPLNWPAFASVLGFLLVPVWLGRRYLSASMQWFLWATLPGLAAMVWFGIWSESRVALEWTMPYALLAATECHAAFLRHTPPESSPEGLPA